MTFGEQHISKSPFKVEVGPVWVTKIVAYGPGLEGGVVNQPAVFTVETNGETGALGQFLLAVYVFNTGSVCLSVRLDFFPDDIS